MSTLKVNTIQNTSAAHSSTPEQIAQGRAKAWINFNGTGTVAIRDSFNVSSVTDVATGRYTINFTSGALADANYTFSGNFCNDDTFANVQTCVQGDGTYSTTELDIRVLNNNNNTIDKFIVCLVVNGN
tara:strand:+ start:12 stop:395 length:384 start_codon:yes stop_codon:yes gene_type:complete